MKKIAYLIIAHEDPNHLSKLVNSIINHSDIYIHIDAKANIEDFKSSCPSSVNFIEERVEVAWAGITMVDALLNLIKSALPYSSKYSHFVFISGSDYPIKTETEIINTFISDPKRQFIKYIDMRNSPNHYLKQINRKHFLEPYIVSSIKAVSFADRLFRKLLRTLKIRNKWQQNMIPYYGHTWCALTPECCSYILDFHINNQWFYESNKNTFAPDEHYFHTIIGNSPFAETSDGLQEFEGSGLWRVVNFHLICPSLKKWFTIDDWHEINSSDKLFVRKLNSKNSEQLVNKINSNR